MISRVHGKLLFHLDFLRHLVWRRRPCRRIALELFSRKATAVATNVPGPQQPLYMGGCAMREMMFWVPQTGSVGIGLSILSYNNRVHFGLISDAKLVPDPDAVIQRFGPEFEKLLYLALYGRLGSPPGFARSRCPGSSFQLNEVLIGRRPFHPDRHPCGR